MSPVDLQFVAVAALAGFTQTVAGFGFMLVASTLGALVVPVSEIVPLALPMSFMSSSWVAFDQRRLIDKRLLGYVILPAMAVGAAVGFVLSGVLPADFMRKLLGVLVLGFVAMRVLRRGRVPSAWPAWLRSGVIVIAGVVQGLFGTGGPLLVLAMEGSRLPPQIFRATLISVWALMNSALVTALFIDGRYDMTVVMRIAQAIPALALGVWAGQRLHARLSPKRFQASVYVMLTAAALSLLL